MGKDVTVTQGEPPIPAEVLADSIVAISAGIKKMRAGRLGDRAVIVLLKDATGVSQRDIKLVIDGMASLEAMYLRKKK